MQVGLAEWERVQVLPHTSESVGTELKRSVILDADIVCPDATGKSTPIFTSAEIEQIIALAKGQDAVLYSVLAAGGMRIGEALALKGF